MSDYVADEEILYRRVPYNRNCYKIVDGCARLTSQAFTDKNRSPSVDRAKLCSNDPTWTQSDSTDGVVSLLASDIREIRTVTSVLESRDDQGQPNRLVYRIDVIPVPIIGIEGQSDNPAHAEIRPTPQYQGGTAFKKLLERLAFLADQRPWEIEPIELRT